MKWLLIAFVLVIPLCHAKEEVPMFPLDNAVRIEVVEDNSADLINVSKMRRSESVEKAKSEATSTMPKRRIELDKRSMNHQRALEYITRPNSMFLPTF